MSPFSARTWVRPDGVVLAPAIREAYAGLPLVVGEGAAVVAQINTALPPGVSVVDYYDQAELVDNSVHTVVESLIEGEALVLIILVLLLGNFRTSFITAAAIPFCIAISRVRDT